MQNWYRNERKNAAKSRRSPNTKTPPSNGRKRQSKASRSPSSSIGHSEKRSRRKSVNPQKATLSEDTSVLEYNMSLAWDNAGMLIPDIGTSLVHSRRWIDQSWRYQWTNQNAWWYESTSVAADHAPVRDSVTIPSTTSPTWAMTLNRGAFGTHVTSSGCHTTRCSTYVR